MPPKKVSKTPEVEKTDSPQRLGIYDPIVEPINAPIQISVFGFIMKV